MTSDVTVQASAAQIKRYTITIQQSTNQTIHVYANGGDYTSSVTLNHGTTWTASVVANSGYKAGTLNISSGTLTGNVTIYASAATQTYQTMTVAEFHMASHLRNYRGADDNHGSLSPASPLHTFVVFTQTWSKPDGEGTVSGLSYRTIVINPSSDTQSQYNSCSSIKCILENFPVMSDGWASEFTLGQRVSITLQKSWLEWHDSSDDYWHESVIGWGCNIDTGGDRPYYAATYEWSVALPSRVYGETSDPNALALYNGLNHAYYNNIQLRLTTVFQ